MKRTVLAGVALLAAGCGSAPPAGTPSVDPALPDSWGARASGEEPGPWWGSFSDERVRAVAEEALSRNHDLAAAAARLEASAEAARIPASEIFPRLDAAGRAARQQQVLTFLREPGTGEPLVSRNTSFGASLEVSWEMDVWGRLRSSRSAAAADFQAQAFDYEGARLSLAAHAVKAWFAAIEARRQVELAEVTAQSFAHTAETVRTRYRRGVRPSVDVRLALVDRAGAAAALAQRKAAHDAAVRRLEVLLGRYPAASLEAEGDLTPPPQAVPAGLPVELLARRPDLRAAERRLAAQDRRLATSRRALLPRLTLTASGGRSSDRLQDLLEGDFTVWALAGSLLQPVFQGGRLRAEVRRQRALRGAAAEEWANRVLTACSEVETLLALETHLADQERAQTEAAAQAGAARDLARSRYESGVADVVTQLTAQRAAAEAESRALEVRRRRLDARVDLHLALGGGFDGPAEEGAS